MRRVQPFPFLCLLFLPFSAIALTQDDAPAMKATSEHYEQRNNPVSEEDVEILDKALSLLADESAWNRDDDRNCDDDESREVRSLFCALQRANMAVLGEYDHRRVAMQEVRFAIEEVSNNRRFEHRLMDFNNLPETSYEDVIAVLKIARRNVGS